MKNHRAERKDDGARRAASREVLVLAVILLVGLLLRVSYLRELIQTPEFTVPAVDAEFHDYWARSIATGDWTPPQGRSDPGIRRNAYLRPPGYPYFLSSVYRVFGPSYLAPRIVHLCLGLASCVLAFLLGRTWYGGGVGLLAAAFMSTSWLLIYFEGQLLEPALLILLLLCCVYILGLWATTALPRYAVMAGVVLSLAALARPNALLLLPIITAWFLWAGYHRHGKRQLSFSVIGFVLASALTIAPASSRNYVVADDFVLVSANAGVNLYVGNNQNADGLFYSSFPGLGEFGTCFDYPGLVRRLERETGRRLKYSQVSRYFADKALKFIKAHPGETLRRMGRKTLLFWGPYEISHNKVIHYERESSGLLRRLPGHFALVSSSFLLGALIFIGDARRKPPARKRISTLTREQICIGVLIIAVIIGYFVSFLPFFNASLYRVPIIPFLLLFAAYGWFRVGQLVHTKAFLSAGLWVVAWIGFYLVARTQFVPYQPDPAEWHRGRAWAYRQTNELGRAVEHYRRALGHQSDDPITHGALASTLALQGKVEEALAHWNTSLALGSGDPGPHIEMGDLYARTGQIDQAVIQYAKAIAMKPDSAVPYNNLANLQSLRGNVGQAIDLYREGLLIEPDAPELYMGLGVALLREGRNTEAIQAYAEAVRLRPGLLEARLNLGLALKQEGRTQEAIAQYGDALRINPADARIHHNMAAVYHEAGQLNEAIKWYTSALEINPRLALTRNRLGRALVESGKINGAIEQFRAACSLRPDYPEAHRNLATALAGAGMGPEAIEAFRDALRLKPDDPETHYGLACVLESVGQTHAAVEELRTVLKLDPQHAGAGEKMRLLSPSLIEP